MTENTFNALMVEMGKAKGLVESLKKEAKNTKLNRVECKHLLFELKATVMAIRQHFSDMMAHTSEQKAKQYEPNFLSFILILSENFRNKDVEKMYDALIIKMGVLATHTIDNPDYYDDKKIKNDVYSITSDLDFLINMFDSSVFRSMHVGIGGLSKIGEFVFQKHFGLDENWAAAACHLIAIDIAVNKKRKDIGLVKDTEEDKSMSFYNRFGDLMKSTKLQNQEISKVVKQLPNPFWKIRTDVVHYGYSPKQDEMEFIVTWSKKIISALS